MGDDKETRRKLLDSAKKEFLEKGYMKASLRTICKNAGVTTGALYFFFEDKEDLLANIVEGPLQGLTALIQAHHEEELGAENAAMDETDVSADLKASSEVVLFLYQYYDIFQILLTKSHGSKYEDIVSRFVDYMEKHYSVLAEQMAEKLGVPKPSGYLIHWMAHMQTDAFVHLLTHEPDVEKAVKNIEGIVVCLVSGWYGMFSPQI